MIRNLRLHRPFQILEPTRWAAAYACGMTETKNPFAHLSVDKSIALRWTLRDIKAKRLMLSPVSDEDLTTLRELGLVEMKNDVPVLTEAGHEALD